MKKLIEAIQAKQSPCVVGLDPTELLIPPQILKHAAHEVIESNSNYDNYTYVRILAQAYEVMNKCIIDAVHTIVPAVKPQIAMYEALGLIGLQVYVNTCKYAQEQGLYVLGDIKRGDIGSTAQAYAQHLSSMRASQLLQQLLQSCNVNIPLEASCNEQSSLWYEDAITVNPYLGSDGIEPFIDVAKEYDKDIFVLIRTSNPSSSQIQQLVMQNSSTLYEHVARLVDQWGALAIDDTQYSRVGAVVGATHPKQGAYLRELLPHTFFLVPGYGAQGGTAQDITGMFDSHGKGAIVNSSRGICAAWKKSVRYNDTLDYAQTCQAVYYASQDAAHAMKEDITSALAYCGKALS